MNHIALKKIQTLVKIKQLKLGNVDRNNKHLTKNKNMIIKYIKKISLPNKIYQLQLNRNLNCVIDISFIRTLLLKLHFQR